MAYADQQMSGNKITAIIIVAIQTHHSIFRPSGPLPEGPGAQPERERTYPKH